MEKILKKGYSGITAQFHAIQGLDTTPPEPPLDMQHVLETYSKVFELPKVLPPNRGEHDHNIPLLLGSQPPSVSPYDYHFSQKNESEKIIQELLDIGVIQTSISPYFSLVVMVLKKEGDWRMYPKFRALNKLTVKDKFPILIIDDLLNELHASPFFHQT